MIVTVVAIVLTRHGHYNLLQGLLDVGLLD